MNKRTKILLIVLVAAVGVTFYFVYTNFLIKKVPTPPGVLIVRPKVKTEFALEILSNPKFIALEEHGELPVQVTQKGKINPFMKF